MPPTALWSSMHIIADVDCIKGIVAGRVARLHQFSFCTLPNSPSTTTRYVLTGSVAGPRSTAPVHTLNSLPCHGHVTVDPSRAPSFNGPPRCVHLACVAQKLPATLNTTASPTNRPEPAGTASMRNWLSLRTSDFAGELATFASVLVRIISLSVPGLGAPVRHSYSNRIVTTHFMLRHAEP